MIIISYDISNNKKRAKFNKYIKQYGHMLQYSVYEIDNSERILNNIISDIKNKFTKMFDDEDSIYIFNSTYVYNRVYIHICNFNRAVKGWLV